MSRPTNSSAACRAAKAVFRGGISFALASCMGLGIENRPGGDIAQHTVDAGTASSVAQAASRYFSSPNLGPPAPEAANHIMSLELDASGASGLDALAGQFV